MTTDDRRWRDLAQQYTLKFLIGRPPWEHEVAYMGAVAAFREAVDAQCPGLSLAEVDALLVEFAAEVDRTKREIATASRA